MDMQLHPVLCEMKLVSHPLTSSLTVIGTEAWVRYYTPRIHPGVISDRFSKLMWVGNSY